MKNIKEEEEEKIILLAWARVIGKCDPIVDYYDKETVCDMNNELWSAVVPNEMIICETYCIHNVMITMEYMPKNREDIIAYLGVIAHGMLPVRRSFAGLKRLFVNPRYKISYERPGEIIVTMTGTFMKIKPEFFDKEREFDEKHNVPQGIKEKRLYKLY